MARTELFDLLTIITPQDGALSGKMHPKWEEACAHAEAQLESIKDAYRRRFAPDASKPRKSEQWIYPFVKDGVAIRNNWLAAHG